MWELITGPVTWVRATLGKACGFPKHLFSIWTRYLITEASLPNVNGTGKPLCFVLMQYICNSLLFISAMEAHAQSKMCKKDQV